MFDVVAKRLMAGEFICQVTCPAEFEYLARNEVVNGRTHSEDLNQYLSRIGMKLSVTASGVAYYITWLDVDDQGRKAAKALFADIKNNLRLLVDFFKLVMDVSGSDYAAMPGQTIDLNRMAGSISQNESLMESLRKVAILCKGVGGDTDRARLDKIVKKLKLDGYLVDVNREQDIYQFTGKIEYFHDAVEFLLQHDEISEEDDAYDDKADMP